MRLAEYRRIHGYSQKAFASEVNKYMRKRGKTLSMSQGNVTSWESGRVPGEKYALAISSFTGGQVTRKDFV